MNRKPEGKAPLGRCMLRWKNNIKINMKKSEDMSRENNIKMGMTKSERMCRFI